MPDGHMTQRRIPKSRMKFSCISKTARYVLHLREPSHPRPNSMQAACRYVPQPQQLGVYITTRYSMSNSGISQSVAGVGPDMQHLPTTRRKPASMRALALSHQTETQLACNLQHGPECCKAMNRLHSRVQTQTTSRESIISDHNSIGIAHGAAAPACSWCCPAYCNGATAAGRVACGVRSVIC